MVFNLILLITKNNMDLLQISIPYIKRNISAKNIYGIASIRLKNDIEKLGINFIDEDTLLDGLTFENVKVLIEKFGKDSNRTGWYFQQFLKFAFSYYTDTQYYLSWDSDTIPLNKIDYFSENGHPFFISKKEYHIPYFKTIEKLFDGEIYRYDKKVSFVAENMMFNRDFVKEIINYIYNNKNLHGENFYEKILFATNRDTFETGFSEFETYGNYMMLKHNGYYNLKKLRTLRRGSLFLGVNPTIQQLEWASKDYDIISIEQSNIRFGYTRFTRDIRFRNKIHLSKLVKTMMPFRYFIDFIRGKEIIIFD